MKRIKKVSQTVPTIAQVVDGHSNSTTDSYSCNYVNGVIYPINTAIDNLTNSKANVMKEFGNLEPGQHKDFELNENYGFFFLRLAKANMEVYKLYASMGPNAYANKIVELASYELINPPDGYSFQIVSSGAYYYARVTNTGSNTFAYMFSKLSLL